jgi:hypothetical protein
MRIGLHSIFRVSVLAVFGLSGAASRAGIVSTVPAGKADVCGQDHFQDFLDRFSEDLEFQKKHTRVPLLSVKYEYDDNTGDAKKIETMLDSSKIEFPVVPNAAQRRKQSLELNLKPAEGGMLVKIRASDGDYQIEYMFERHSCWELARMEDSSL